MNRREFLCVSGVAAASVGAGRALGAAAVEQGKPFGFASAPVLLNPAADGVTVVFALASAGTGWVEYGETEALGSRADGGDGGLLPYTENVVRVRLSGLKTGTRYFYRVHACPVDFKG